MKYWRGYLTAVIFAIFTYLLQEFAASHAVIVDMVYPYITRMVQDMLAQWTLSYDGLLWQMALVMLGVGIMVTIVLMILLKWNPIQWFGWILAVGSLLFFLHTGVYGMNMFSGSIADDIRMEELDYDISQLAAATTYYRDKANELAPQVKRDAQGNVQFASFDQLAIQAEDGFQSLVHDYSYPVFAGCTLPVKELGWADRFTSMGITGITVPLTGEAAVNPQIPPVTLPFTICHEMAHRMAISIEKDANFAAFLACQANESLEFQYSAYFMAYLYCYNTLAAYDTDASNQYMRDITAGVCDELVQDRLYYSNFYSENQSKAATNMADTVNDALIKASGDEEGIASYDNVTDHLVSWHYMQVILPTQIEEEQIFDPFDTTQVDISGIHGLGG